MKIKKSFVLHLLMLAGCNGIHHPNKHHIGLPTVHSDKKSKEPALIHAPDTSSRPVIAPGLIDPNASRSVATSYAIGAGGLAGAAYIMGAGGLTGSAATAALTFASGSFAAGAVRISSSCANAIGAAACAVATGALTVDAIAANDGYVTYCRGALAVGAGALAMGAVALATYATHANTSANTNGVAPEVVVHDTNLMR